MSQRSMAATLLVSALLLTACQTTTETEVVTIAQSTATTELREFDLPPTTAISIRVGVDGSTRSLVTIPAGHPGAGTYVTESEHLLPNLQDASGTLGEPGVEASITVNEAAEIVGVSHTVTLQ